MLIMNLVKFIPGYVQRDFPWISTSQILYCSTQSKKKTTQVSYIIYQ